MKIKLSPKSADSHVVDLIVLPVREGAETKAVAVLPKTAARQVRARVEKVGFAGKAGKTLVVQTEAGDVLLFGVGDGSRADVWRKPARSILEASRACRAATVAIAAETDQDLDERAEALLESMLLAAYRFDRHKGGRTSNGDDDYRAPAQLVLCGASIRNTKTARTRLDQLSALCEAVCTARDLVNEPPAGKTPKRLAQVARSIARRGGLQCEVWQGARLVKERMNGILAVSAGSAEPGVLVHMVYKPRGKARRKVAVVGKGITFDSGGLSLKPPKSMETMKMDMAGAAAVLGLMQALPSFAPNVEVHGYIASAENLPSGTAQKPGDVIRFRNGTTAEVLNTDAEGRLVLADALCLANEGKPDAIIDLATLTGACMVALGTQVAGVMGNDQELVDAIIEHGGRAGEQLWQLPLVEAYADDIRSPVADIKNIGGGYAGTITAALFLRCFVGDSPWAHLDIAGPAFSEKALVDSPRGATGFGIRTLVAYLRSLS
jgi:leucyl aminopeptidase